MTDSGEPANTAPVADAGLDDSVVFGDIASLDGSGSSDADGDPLTYSWTFDALPAESALTAENITVPEDDPETDDVNESAFPSFTPDVLGTFRISLVVTDEDEAASSPGIVVVQSVPPSELAIHLDWEDTRADLDLHLIGPDGTYFGEDDCFSWNPNPNWGDPELATDNPLLGSDSDGEGSGPYRETISLDAPLDGSYEVWVHYYSDHQEELGHTAVPANPTVDIEVFGSSLLDAEAVVPTPMLAGDVWKVGVLAWPDRSWAPLNGESTHTAEGGPNYNE